MKITKRQLKRIIREEYRRIARQRRLVESNYPWEPYPSNDPPVDPKLVKLSKLILSGDLESMRQGIDLGEAAEIITINEFEDRTATYTRYKDMPPETHLVFKVEFITSPEFHDLLRKMYADIPKESSRSKNWQEMIDFDFGGLSKEPKVKIFFSDDYEYYSSKWTNQRQFKTY